MLRKFFIEETKETLKKQNKTKYTRNYALGTHTNCDKLGKAEEQPITLKMPNYTFLISRNTQIIK